VTDPAQWAVVPLDDSGYIDKVTGEQRDEAEIDWNTEHTTPTPNPKTGCATPPLPRSTASTSNEQVRAELDLVRGDPDRYQHLHVTVHGDRVVIAAGYDPALNAGLREANNGRSRPRPRVPVPVHLFAHRPHPGSSGAKSQ